MNVWRLNTAAISIEKLLDEILKEIKKDNGSEKIKFNFVSGACENFSYNMSYLSTIVHPLIIIRLLEHRLFTPLLKKTNSRAPVTPNQQITSVNLSKISSTNIDNDINYLKVNNDINQNKTSNESVHSSSIEQTNNESSNIKNNFNNDPNELFSIVPLQNNENVVTIAASNNNKPIGSTSYLKDLSEKLLKRVNINNQSTKFKKSFKSKNKPSGDHDDLNANQDIVLHPKGYRNSLASIYDHNALSINENSIAIPEISSATTGHIVGSSYYHYGSPLDIKFNSVEPSIQFLKDSVVNNDSCSVNGNNYYLKMDLKEFEKKLINLPTFTISDENETAAAFLPNAVSNLSLFVKDEEQNNKSSILIENIQKITEKNSPKIHVKSIKASVTSHIIRVDPKGNELSKLQDETPSIKTTTITTKTIINPKVVVTRKLTKPFSKSESQLFNNENKKIEIKKSSSLNVDLDGSRKKVVQMRELNKTFNINICFGKNSKKSSKSLENINENKMSLNELNKKFNSMPVNLNRKLIIKNTKSNNNNSLTRKGSRRDQNNIERESKSAAKSCSTTRPTYSINENDLFHSLLNNKSKEKSPLALYSYLEAPKKSRRVRSNSPSFFNKNDKQLNLTMINSNCNESNQKNCKSHNHLLTITTANQANSMDKKSVKSMESTNSSFSVGFLPSPEMNSPSAVSLNFTNSNSNIGETKININEKNQLNNLEQNRFYLKKSITSTSILNESIPKASNSLMPIKITVLNETGSVTCSDICSNNNHEIQSTNDLLIADLSNNKKTSKTNNELTVPSENLNNSQLSKPGSEVLTLISTWIKNSPNDFMDSRVLNEIKLFFHQLDSLKSSYKPWTTKLKTLLKLDEIENNQDHIVETVNNEDILNQYESMLNMIISGKLPCNKDECTTLAAIQLRIHELNHFKSKEYSSDDNIDKTNVELEVLITNNCSNNRKNILKKLTSQKNGYPFLLTRNNYQSLLIYLKSCSCMKVSSKSKILNIKELVPPEYKHSNDVLKLIKAKRERLSKTTYFNDELKLKENYMKTCKNLICYGCVLFEVKEIIYGSNNRTNLNSTRHRNSYGQYQIQSSLSVTNRSFKKIKRILSIKPNKITLIDFKTKLFVKSQRITDLKSWFSGDGYYNLTPVFLLNPYSTNHSNEQALGSDNINETRNKSINSTAPDNLFIKNLFHLKPNHIDINKLFVIEFLNSKWYLQVDDFESLKSITCILLDQSLDMGIDSNPLMLDLTISEHYQNKHKNNILSDKNYNNNRMTEFTKNDNNNSFTLSGEASINNKNLKRFQSYYGGISSKRKLNYNLNSAKVETYNGHSTSFKARDKKSTFNSGKISNENSSIISTHKNNDSTVEKSSKIKLFNEKSNNLFHLSLLDPSINYKNNITFLYNKSSSTTNNNAISYKYEMEFQELQVILLWFPEEVAFRLTNVEYELFKQVPPVEYLRHVTLDMNHFKSSYHMIYYDHNQKNMPLIKSTSTNFSENSSNMDNKSSSLVNATISTKTVQDLIVRYKEVSSWIKKLIQSQPSADKRIAIILSAIRCAITCWNIGNFNSSREIWLGLKYGLYFLNI